MIDVRAATSLDLNLCVDLNNSSLLSALSDPGGGFLLSKMSVEELARFNRTGIVRIAVMKEQFAGFIVAFKRDTDFFNGLLPLLAKVEWIDPAIPLM